MLCFLVCRGWKHITLFFVYDTLFKVNVICSLENTDSQTIAAFTTTITYTKSLYIEIQYNKKYFPQRMI